METSSSRAVAGQPEREVGELAVPSLHSCCFVSWVSSPLREHHSAHVSPLAGYILELYSTSAGADQICFHAQKDLCQGQDTLCAMRHSRFPDPIHHNLLLCLFDNQDILFDKDRWH